MSDVLEQVARRLDEEDEAKTFKGKTSWSKKAVDREVLELSDDDRIAVALRRAAGIFERANMPFTSALLKHASKTIEVFSE